LRRREDLLDSQSILEIRVERLVGGERRQKIGNRTNECMLVANDVTWRPEVRSAASNGRVNQELEMDSNR